MGDITRNRIIEYTQAAIAVGVMGAFVAASTVGLSGASDLKDIALIIVGFYFAKRGAYGANGTPKSS